MRKVTEFFNVMPDKQLFHYTSINGLLGIIESNKIWASHAYYLNDSREITHASIVIDKMIDEYIKEKYVKDNYAEGGYVENGTETELLQQFRDWIKTFETKEFYIFVFSMSEEANLLSQWRSYTPHGKGISAGFAPDTLKEICRLNDLKLSKCLYEHEEHKDVMSSLLDKLITTFGQRLTKEALDTEGKNTTQRFHKFLDEFQEDILQVLAIIKHPAFKEEKEWRLISLHHDKYFIDELKFREGASLLVPFIEIELPNYPIFNKVYLGPTQHESLSMSSLKAYLRKNNDCEDVISSRIPYRKW